MADAAADPFPDPFKVTILVLPGSSMMTVASCLEPLRALNRVSGAERVRWRALTPDGGGVTLSNGLPFAGHGAFDSEAGGDLLLVVAGFDALRHAPRAALRRALPRFGAFAGIEAGAWVLGALGVLDGRRATTHWEDFEEFAARHPGTDVVADRWVIDGRVMTAGGASPAFDLMAHLIRARWGEAVALDVASVFVYDEARAASEPQPLVSLGRLSAREPRVAAAVRAMEAALDHPLSTEAIARRAGLSVRRLETLFRATLGTSPGAYYAGLRLLAARRMVADTDLALGEVALRTGFGSLSAFSRSFRRQTGTAPRDARAAARASPGGASP